MLKHSIPYYCTIGTSTVYSITFAHLIKINELWDCNCDSRLIFDLNIIEEIDSKITLLGLKP